jgi:hypothetical protein
MEAVRIRTRLESESIFLPDLKPVIGRKVEIIVLIEPFEKYAHKRVPGSAIGKIQMADDFEAPLSEDIIQEFYA